MIVLQVFVASAHIVFHMTTLFPIAIALCSEGMGVYSPYSMSYIWILPDPATYNSSLPFLAKDDAHTLSIPPNPFALETFLHAYDLSS